MAYWKNGAFAVDKWSKLDEGETPNGSAQFILPLADFLALPSNRHSEFGVHLLADDDLDDLLTLPGLDINQVPLVALDFPSFADGRSYSKAQILRQHYGFRGEIRATGDVLPDQLPLILRVGFDALDVSHPISIERLEAGLPFAVTKFMQVAPAAVSALNDEKPTSPYSWRRAASR